MRYRRALESLLNFFKKNVNGIDITNKKVENNLVVLEGIRTERTKNEIVAAAGIAGKDIATFSFYENKKNSDILTFVTYLLEDQTWPACGHKGDRGRRIVLRVYDVIARDGPSGSKGGM